MIKKMTREHNTTVETRRQKMNELYYPVPEGFDQLDAAENELFTFVFSRHPFERYFLKKTHYRNKFD